MAPFLAGRVPFLCDYELEPICRGLIEELRREGLRATLSRRHEAVLFGTPDDVPMPAGAGRMETRIFGNVMHHLVPRLLDAIHARELGAVLPRFPPGVEAALRAAGYAPGAAGPHAAWLKRRS